MPVYMAQICFCVTIIFIIVVVDDDDNDDNNDSIQDIGAEE